MRCNEATRQRIVVNGLREEYEHIRSIARDWGITMARVRSTWILRPRRNYSDEEIRKASGQSERESAFLCVAFVYLQTARCRGGPLYARERGGSTVPFRRLSLSLPRFLAKAFLIRLLSAPRLCRKACHADASQVRAANHGCFWLLREKCPLTQKHLSEFYIEQLGTTSIELKVPSDLI